MAELQPATQKTAINRHSMILVSVARCSYIKHIKGNYSIVFALNIYFSPLQAIESEGKDPAAYAFEVIDSPKKPGIASKLTLKEGEYL